MHSQAIKELIPKLKSPQAFVIQIKPYTLTLSGTSANTAFFDSFIWPDGEEASI